MRSLRVVSLLALSILVMASFEPLVFGAREMRAGEPKCSGRDLVIMQTQTGPLPSGIPVYRVHIQNVNPYGISMSNVHLKCGRFSSAVLINPKIFKRLAIDDCLVKDGKTLDAGSIVVFQYADSFSYPLSVRDVKCSSG